MIENIVSLNQLKNVSRFFIFGQGLLADDLQMFLSGAFPGRFFGFIGMDDGRHGPSQYSIFPIHYATGMLCKGDFVFLCEENQSVVNTLQALQVRMGYGENLVTIYRTYELPTFVMFLEKYAKNYCFALDIGANHGLTTALMAYYCNHVHAFEPSPILQGSIGHHTKYCQNVTIHEMAVSDVDGPITVYDVDGSNTTMRPTAAGDFYDVQSTTIDTFCKTKNVKPKLIKIDVEGVESEVILGAMKVIEACRPVLFLEHPLLNAGAYAIDKDKATKVLNFLKSEYTLLAYPDLNSLCDCDDIGMPLDDYVLTYKTFPTNIAAVV